MKLILEIAIYLMGLSAAVFMVHAIIQWFFNYSDRKEPKLKELDPDDDARGFKIYTRPDRRD